MIWNESLATGLKEIDDQHKELIQRINGFLSSCMNQQGKDNIEATLNFVESYVAEHFADEEKLHASSKYPKSLIHKSIHENFVREFINLKRRLAVEGPVLTVMLDANKLLVDWLIQHINNADKEFANFYKARV